MCQAAAGALGDSPHPRRHRPYCGPCHLGTAAFVAIADGGIVDGGYGGCSLGLVLLPWFCAFICLHR